MSIGSLAATYAGKGWQVVKLWGVAEPGVCTCWRGQDCGTPGKHPQGDAWQTRTSSNEDTIAGWFDGTQPINIGLLLGPRSGVVDVELDGPEAKAAWDALGLGEVWTPTYVAGRGPHRLFRWDEGLPAVGVRKVMGIEVRIGNGAKAFQSVLPPSTHHTGKKYEWVEGMGPDEVELQPLPERLVNLLWNDDGTGERLFAPQQRPARAIIHTTINEGGRNNDLYRFAVREAFRAGPNLDDHNEQQDLLAIIQAVNTTRCKPPLSDDEVRTIYWGSIAFVRKTRSQLVDPQSAMASADIATQGTETNGAQAVAPKRTHTVFTEHGLSFSTLVPDANSDPEWGPGEWQLTVVHSDPLEYRLNVPAWKRFTANGTGNVSLTVDQYRSAAKVASCVLAATGLVMLDAEPGLWKRIWDGGVKVKDNLGSAHEHPRKTRGVKAKMLDGAVEEWPGASSLRYVILAGWLYDKLSQASQPSDDDIPDPTGRACWRADGTLWFNWSKVWEDIERQHRVMEGERLATKHRLLATLGTPGADFEHAQFTHVSGIRKSYVVWTRQTFTAVERMAAEVQNRVDAV